MDATSANTADVVTSSSTSPAYLSVNNAFGSSPIQKLPVELIESICLYVAPPEDSVNPCGKDQWWSLSQVCRFWRRVVVSSVRLWQHINVFVPLLAQLRDPVALLSLTLSRTSRADLFINFDGNPEVDDEGFPVDINGCSELALTLLEILIARSTQWHSVIFRGLDPDCADALAAMRGPIPRLSYLCMPWRPASDALIHLTSGPQLQEISIWSVDEDMVTLFPFHTQPLPLQGRTAAYGCTLVDLLRRCSNLTSLTMTNFYSSPPVEVRVASELTELFFAGDYHDLTLVHLPKLETIRIGNRIRAAPSLEIGLPSLLDLLEYSRCPLDYLELVNPDLSVGSLTKIVELVPNLTELFLFFEYLPLNPTTIADVDRALSKFMADLANMVLLPRLQRLLFAFHKVDADWSDFTFLSNKDLATMLGRRNKQSGLQACCRFGNDFIGEYGWQAAKLGDPSDS